MRDFWRGKITPRELMVLVKFLPVDSEFIKAAAPDVAEVASWTSTTHIVAALFDLTAKAHFKDPKPLPRPVDAINERKRRERREAALEAQAERNRVRQLEAADRGEAS